MEENGLIKFVPNHEFTYALFCTKPLETQYLDYFLCYMIYNNVLCIERLDGHLSWP